MPTKSEARAEAERLFDLFRRAGATPVEADILQPAETLLDLYGEDIRARAYVTADPLRGEMMLRPDFTVPVVQMHMANGADPARYTYMGEVFRRQERSGPRTNEFFQVGYEVFARENPPDADAEVFALFADTLAPLGLTASTGDIGILTAAVAGLQTTDARKRALMRHLWRPRRFRALLDRFGGRTPPSDTRRRLLNHLAHPDPAELIAVAGPLVGKRGQDEIEARIAALLQDAETPPLSDLEMQTFDDLLALREPMVEALERLRDLAVDLPSLDPAVDRVESRMVALRDRGVDVDRLEFEAAYGRTSLEYYDGFVFGLYAPDRPGLPPVVSGGRYDALTARLGAGRSIPAVGGVVRPGLVALLKGAA